MNSRIILSGITLLVSGLSFLTPEPASAQETAKAKAPTTPALHYTRYPSRFYDSRPFTPDQKLLLRFNEEVDVEQVSQHFSFFERSKQTNIPANASRPSREEILSFGRRLVPQSGDLSQALLHRFVVIEPNSHLATGFDWHLRVGAGLASRSKSHTYHKTTEDRLGSLSAFQIQSVEAVNEYDEEMYILIVHNKYGLNSRFDEELLTQYVEVTPRPEEFRLEAEGPDIRVRGNFEYHRKYKVVVKPGILARDRIQLNQQYEEEVLFDPNRGFVSLPLFSATQNASGKRTFDVKTANLQSVRTRVKRLRNEGLIFALKGYSDAYRGEGEQRSIPFSMVSGKTIYDQTRARKAKIDTTESFTLDWSNIDPESPYGAYYLCTEGESEPHPEYTLGAQALVQLTDIGLVWKQTPEETLVYAFSIKSGQPKVEIPIRLVDDEGEEIAFTATGPHGLARFSADKYKGRDLWLDAVDGEDRHIMAFSKDLSMIGLWSFGIPYRYDGVEEGERRTLIFTDRDVYKPGDTVYLKSISRTIDSDRLLAPAKSKAQLTVTDSRGMKLFTREISFSENGSFDDSFQLPEAGLGYHSIKIDFNDPDNPGDREWSRMGHHSFNVAEYRVNTFEVSLKSKNLVAEKQVTIPLSAKYFMGKPLSKAVVNWNAYSTNRFPNPDGFHEFRFGDRFQDSDGFSENDEIRLSGKGEARIDLEVPLDAEIPAPRFVSVRAEVTDVNQQTITGSTRFTVHSSDFYIGLRKPEGIHRAGDKVPFLIANIDTEGKVYPLPVDTSITVEKEIWNTVKVKGSDGKISLRNEKHHDLKLHETISVQTASDPETNLPRVQSHSITFEEAGDYVITLESADAEGRRIVTRDRFRVIGVDEPSWSWNDVVRIDLIPDKKSYQVGDTAKLLVRSPVFGHALLTTERGNVKTTQPIEITKHESIVEVPIEPGAAPNIYASLLLIRGSESSPHKYAAADYRLGYCQLDVEDPGIDLKVAIDKGDPEYYIPGQPVTVSALVSDGMDRPVPGAEVTLFAVDEGILSLTDYRTPDPGRVFNEAFPLSVMMGQSLSRLFPENPLERDFGNKGYVIGGGGAMDNASGDLSRVRKDFKAVAFWKPNLKTDQNGKVSCQFKAPDNLTSFRVIAVVAKKNRFGSADENLVVNKPIIVEPALPSFSNLSDRIDITAVLHNNTREVQELEVTVSMDDHAIFLKDLGEVIPTNLSNLPKDSKRRINKLQIDPGQTEVLHFPVGMTKTGEAKWKWKAASLTNPDLVDTTESNLQVGYPLPVLKSSKYSSTKKAGRVDNLLSDVEPRLLEGRGDIEITISNSRAVEAADGLDYLLKYPYGCVEQTTSSTIPWLSTKNMRSVLPNLNVSEKELDAAIVSGTSRLFTMQTHNGGLAYWPGDHEAVLWGSAYGGLALALAKQGGIDLPEDRLNRLWSYLSQNLRNSAALSDPYELSQRCLAVYTLAVAGKPEASYHDVLFEKRAELPREARALLALAMLRSDPDGKAPDRKRIETLLTMKDTDVESGVRWYQRPYLAATELMAWAHFRPGDARTGRLLNELIKLKKPHRGWGSTYSNAWPIMALSSHSEAEASQGANEIEVQFGDRVETVSFDGSLKSKTFRFPFTGDRRAVPLVMKQDRSGTIYTNVRVATQPKLIPMEPENRGFSIKRSYVKVDPEGNLQPVDDLTVGDLVMVRLEMELPGEKEEYLAIDDPLPSILEAINPTFTTRGTRRVNDKRDKVDKPRKLYTNYRELRKDRTLFFANYVHRAGTYEVQYLARVIAAGDSIAPPAKIESMYEPDRFGLSGTEQLSAQVLDLKDNQIAQR